MATCAACNSFILFGGDKAENLRFCNAKCREQGEVLIAAQNIADAVVAAAACEVHNGACPTCGRNERVELHKSYEIASFLLYTRYKTNTHLCCLGCARKQQVTDLLASAALGWWGVPWGVLLTPVQLLRNLFALLLPPANAAPSGEMLDAVRLILARQQKEEQQNSAEVATEVPGPACQNPVS